MAGICWTRSRSHQLLSIARPFLSVITLMVGGFVLSQLDLSPYATGWFRTVDAVLAYGLVCGAACLPWLLRWMKLTMPVCRQCGYLVGDQPEDISHCPECGRAWNARGVRSAKLRVSRRALGVLAAFVLVSMSVHLSRAQLLRQLPVSQLVAEVQTNQGPIPRLVWDRIVQSSWPAQQLERVGHAVMDRSQDGLPVPENVRQWLAKLIIEHRAPRSLADRGWASMLHFAVSGPQYVMLHDRAEYTLFGRDRRFDDDYWLQLRPNGLWNVYWEATFDDGKGVTRYRAPYPGSVSFEGAIFMHDRIETVDGKTTRFIAPVQFPLVATKAGTVELRVRLWAVLHAGGTGQNRRDLADPVVWEADGVPELPQSVEWVYQAEQTKTIRIE